MRQQVPAELTEPVPVDNRPLNTTRDLAASYAVNTASAKQANAQLAAIRKIVTVQ